MESTDRSTRSSQLLPSFHRLLQQWEAWRWHRGTADTNHPTSWVNGIFKYKHATWSSHESISKSNEMEGCHRLWDLRRDGTSSCMDPRGSSSRESPRDRSNEEPWQAIIIWPKTYKVSQVLNIPKANCRERDWSTNVLCIYIYIYTNMHQNVKDISRFKLATVRGNDLPLSHRL